MKPVKPLTVIWDFNGTILDDVGVGIDSINALLTRRGLPVLSGREKYQRIFRFPIIDYYADLGLDVSDYDNLAHEWIAEYMNRVPDAPLQPGVREVIEALHERGIPQVILSATEQTQLTKQVRSLGIADYFDAILGTGDIYAHSKLDVARAFRASHPERLLLIGDTDHDAAAAEALGGDCILLAYGHQSREALSAIGPIVLGGADEILDFLKEYAP